MSLFFLFTLIFLLIINNQLVLTGASYGLMLWYKNVLPLLLPFMLISGHIENCLMQNTRNTKSNKKLAIPTIIILGLFCGYPIGAKATSVFIKSNIINRRAGNILLPLCNNVSPMFFMGFIISNTLKNNISPFVGYVAIFTPYILFLIIEIIFYPKIGTNNFLQSKHENISIDRSISQESINQITHVGLYIMLCCIITEFILSFDIITPKLKLLLVGATEITRGVTYISVTKHIDNQIKTALILACTSFGGISSVMQTAKVIQGSGLSLIHYIFVKIICAVCTFFLYLLII